MCKNLFSANQRKIDEMKAILEDIEVKLLEFMVSDVKIHELIEVGFWANELLQTRISFAERKELYRLIQWVKDLQILYFESSFDLYANQLSQKLKELVSKEAWQIYLALDEIKGIEREFLQGKDYYKDFNLDLSYLELELISKLSALSMKV